jgi:hypothetical protein
MVLDRTNKRTQRLKEVEKEIGAIEAAPHVFELNLAWMKKDIPPLIEENGERLQGVI